MRSSSRKISGWLQGAGGGNFGVAARRGKAEVYGLWKPDADLLNGGGGGNQRRHIMAHV